MNRFLKRPISLFLALALIGTQAFLPAFAEQSESPEAVNLAFGKTEFSIRYGGSSEDVYSGDPDRHTIGEVETASIARLTDGVLLTDPDNKDFEANWVGGIWNETTRTRGKYVNFYRGDSRDIILDLGQLSHLEKMSMHFAGGGYGINFPTAVTWYLSEDGTSYYKVGEVTPDTAVTDPVVCTTQGGDQAMEHKYFTVDGMNYNARYVRVRFNVPVWIFADELQVYGTASPSLSADELPQDDKLVEVEPVNQYTSASQSGGVMQEYLAYQGWGTVNSVLTPTYKTVEEYKEVVSYENTSGVSVDWMYDGVTVLPHANTAREGVYNILMSSTSSADSYAQKSDWQEWLDHVFTYDGGNGSVTNMDALEEAVEQAKLELVPNETLTQQDIDHHKVHVKLALTPTVHFQNDWGTVDERLNVTKEQDGTFSFAEESSTESMDFTLSGHQGDRMAALSDRASAMNWYINAVIEAWNAKGYENLELDGFYYYEEKIVASEDSLAEDTIKIYNALIDRAAEEHQLGKLYSYWIPFYLAEGFKQWKEYGFDYAIMQPNYVFDSTATATRIDAAAQLAYTYGLGVEIEYSSAKVPGFKQYLLKGETLGYQGSVQAWYWGTWDPHNLANSASPSQRELYDMSYTYIKGRSVNSDNLLAGATLTLDVGRTKTEAGTTQLAKARNQLGTLTDGTLMAAAWSQEQCVAVQPNNIGGPVELTADLGKLYNLNEISLSFYDRVGYGISEPYQVIYFVSDDGKAWQRMDAATSTQGGNEYSKVFTLQSDELYAKFIKAQVYYKVNPASANGTDYYGWLAMEEFSAKGTAASSGSSVRSLSGQGRQLVEADGLAWTKSTGEAITSGTQGTLAVLADGEKNGTWNAEYVGCTQAAAAGPYQLIADLGEEAIIYDVALNFFHWSSAGVGEPANVIFSYSQDGTTWQRLGTVSQPVATAKSTTNPTEQYGMEYILSQASAPFTARYIRADFDRQNNYLTQSGSVWGWLAMDEFTVMGIPVNDPDAPTELEGTSILTSDMLSIAMDGCTSEEELQKANAAVAVLTDGIAGAKWPYAYNNPASSAYIGFNQGHGSGPYYVTADLKDVYSISGVSLNFYHEAAPGIYRPDTVAYEYSLDGTSWHELSVTSNYLNQSVAGTSAFKSHYVKTLQEPVNARYIRAVFDRARRIDDTHPESGNHRWSWIGFDEMKVVGTKVSGSPDPDPGLNVGESTSGTSNTSSPSIRLTEENSSGVYVTMQAGQLPAGIAPADVAFSAVELEPQSETVKAVSSALAAASLPAAHGITVYDMDMLRKSSGQKVDFDGKIIVSLLVPQGAGDHLRVFYVADDGQLTEIYAVIRDGQIEFAVEHFSHYAIVDFVSYAGSYPLTVQAFATESTESSVELPETADTDTAKNPQTGLAVIPAGLWMLTALSGAVALRTGKKNCK